MGGLASHIPVRQMNDLSTPGIGTEHVYVVLSMEQTDSKQQETLLAKSMPICQGVILYFCPTPETVWSKKVARSRARRRCTNMYGINSELQENARPR